MLVTISNWLQPLTFFVSSLAALFAWMSKFRWSKEYSQAKDEVIRAKEGVIQVKEARIKNLEAELVRVEATPARIQQWYKDSLAQYEQIHDALQLKLSSAIDQLDSKDKEIERLLLRNTSLTEGEIQVLQSRNEIQRQIGAIEFQAGQLRPITGPSLNTDEHAGPTDPFGIALQHIGWWAEALLKTVSWPH